MQSISRRSLSVLVPTLLAVATIVLLPASAAAATKHVTMGNSQSSYSPTRVTVALGGKVKWTNVKTSYFDHDVTAYKPYHLFLSGSLPGNLKPGNSYSHTFTSAGTYEYICQIHPGMIGYVAVSMTVTRTGSPERFKITVGTSNIPSSSPWERVVQVDLPSVGTSYVTIKTTRSASFKYTPTKHGTYRFRSYLKSTGSAGKSEMSPVVSISH